MIAKDRTELFDPNWPELVQDPYPAFHRLRSQDPVHWSAAMDSWLISRYADVVAVLRDVRFSSDRRLWAERQPSSSRNLLAERRIKAAEDSLGAAGRVGTMINVDPPEHVRLRQQATRLFAPPAVEAQRPAIQALVDDLLAATDGHMDVMNDFAIPLAVIGIADMLGIPARDREMIFRWSEAFGAVLDFLDPDECQNAARSSAEMTDYLRPHIEERRRSPAGDLLSDLVAPASGGRSLSDDEVTATCTLLLSALRNGAYVIGNGLFALLRAPDQLQKLQRNPSMIEAGVEELLRYDGPVFSVARLATQDVKLGVKQIRKGQAVQVLLQAANRDPAQFPNPDELDVSRRPNHHLAFGYGTHVCLGKWLARAQAQVAVSTLLRRFPNLRLDAKPAVWRGALLERRLKTLPVLL